MHSDCVTNEDKTKIVCYIEYAPKNHENEFFNKNGKLYPWDSSLYDDWKRPIPRLVIYFSHLIASDTDNK